MVLLHDKRNSSYPELVQRLRAQKAKERQEDSRQQRGKFAHVAIKKSKG
jgi:hypothetical protein